MFSEQEQNEIIDEFLDVIKAKDYINNKRQKRRTCKCNLYKNHDRYCVLNEFSLPENILKHIYNFTYRCYDCEQDEEKEEKMVDVLTERGFWRFNMEKMILQIEHTFPCYDIVKTIIPGIKSRRYNKLQRIFDEIMPCKDKGEIKNY